MTNENADFAAAAASAVHNARDLSNVTIGGRDERTDKFTLANYLNVGVRTIENWLAEGTIHARLEGNRVVFSLMDCELSLFRSTDPRFGNLGHLKSLHDLAQSISEERKPYMTLKELATHFGVCPRDITLWKSAGLLDGAFIQVRRVLRVNLAACEKRLLGNAIL